MLPFDRKDEALSTLAYLSPLLIILGLASFYPEFPDPADGPVDSDAIRQVASRYLLVVGVQVLLASAFVVWFWPIYRRQLEWRVSWWALLVGGLGFFLWIGLCLPQWEPAILERLGLDMTRPGFDPGVIDDPLTHAAFLTCRFALLVLVIPVAEELFLRGWLVRWVESPNYEQVKLTSVGWKPLLAASLYGVLTHPVEVIAAFVWFGWVSILMKRTGSVGDCIVAHATTNLMLGIYVLSFHQWHLW